MAECVLNNREERDLVRKIRADPADHLLPNMKKHAHDSESLRNGSSDLSKDEGISE